MSGIDAVAHCVMIATSVALGISPDWTIWGTRSLPICAPTQIFCSIFSARMVTTNAFVTVTVGCVAVGVLIARIVSVIDACLLFVEGVAFVIAEGSAKLQPLVVIVNNINNRYMRTMTTSIIAFSRKYIVVYVNQ